MTRLMTEKEKEREARNSQIRADYEALKQEFPGCAKWRYFTKLADMYSLSPVQIRTILGV